MPLYRKQIIIEVPSAIPDLIKTIADAGDYSLMVDSTKTPYRITKANLLAGLSSGSSNGGSGSSSSEVDNLFSDVLLLLSNDGTALLDKSSFGNSFFNAGVTLNPTSKFGANSAYFAGGANVATIPNRTEFNLGNGDFTVEAWVYPTVLDGNPRHIISKVGNLSDNNNRSYALSVFTNKIRWYWTVDGANNYGLIDFPCTLNTNTWYHIAISRSENTLYAFLGGISLPSVSHTATYFNSTANITIGSFGGYAADENLQYSFIVNIEKNGLRLTRKCRYTASFTLPNKAFLTQ
ncbi:LamG domain-containing protein [uncultured Nostoc sp.]|uniref:LamG domain-containing protein n=1 Tax=uncultured Nostoc sp. TaxID=340711 RepID=UPI0035CC5C8A